MSVWSSFIDGAISLDASLALDLSARTIGIAVAITSLERACGHRYYRNGEALSWEVIRERFPNRGKRPYTKVLDVLFGYPVFPLLVASRGWAGIALALVGPSTPWTIPLLAFVFLVGLLSTWRSHDLGHSAMDRAILLVTGALFLGAFAPRSEAVPYAVAAFIAFNGAFCYFKSALYKLRDREWRSGVKALSVVDTRFLGRPRLARFFSRHPVITRLATWKVLAVELAFPLALLLGPKVALAFVVWGVAFHLWNWCALGLRGFTWTFAAYYPPIVCCSAAIARLAAG